MRRLLLGSAGSLLTLGVLMLGGGAPPAHALDPSKGYGGACFGADAQTGTTVVVDFGELDAGNPGAPSAPRIVRCSPNPAPSPPRTGLQAMQDAGIEPTGTSRWGLGFICRIERRPGQNERIPVGGNPNYREPCVNTPPAAAYWSYWHADGTGHTWTYSSYGVANRNAVPGGFEGWSWSQNRSASANPPPRHDPFNPAASSTAPTVALSVDDLDRTIALGQSTNLSWTSTRATSITAAGVAPASGGGSWSGALAAPSGSKTVKPTARGTYTYTIRARSASGATATTTATLTVN